MTDVITGREAQSFLFLPSTSLNTHVRPLPRLYSDNLQSSTPSSDCCLVLLYHPSPSTAFPLPDDAPPVKGLRAGLKSLVLCARSQVERDVWVAALESEIGRMRTRGKGNGREEKLIGSGGSLG